MRMWVLRLSEQFFPFPISLFYEHSGEEHRRELSSTRESFCTHFLRSIKNYAWRLEGWTCSVSPNFHTQKVMQVRLLSFHLPFHDGRKWTFPPSLITNSTPDTFLCMKIQNFFTAFMNYAGAYKLPINIPVMNYWWTWCMRINISPTTTLEITWKNLKLHTSSQENFFWYRM